MEDKALDVARMVTRTGADRDAVAAELQRIMNTQAVSQGARLRIEEAIRVLSRGSQGVVNQ